MNICKNCGVELEAEMPVCPLCQEPVTGQGSAQPAIKVPQPFLQHHPIMSQPQKKFTWEIISLILLSCIITTFLINYIINKKISWSEYPVAISLTIFSYVSIFAFWRRQTIPQLAASFILSSLFLILLDALTGPVKWSIKLGIPLLLAVNLVVTILVTITRLSKHKGINLVAYAFLAAALLCLGTEAVLSNFKTGSFHFNWSIIVAGCATPIALVLFFVYFRLKKGRSLEKTFHI
jgi:hypothetical protein